MSTRIEQALRATGVVTQRLDTAVGFAFLLPKLPASFPTRGITSSEGVFLISDCNPEDLIAAYLPDATIIESGVLLLEGVEVPVYRCLPPSAPRPHGKRISEGQDNLKRRADWFQKRTRGTEP